MKNIITFIITMFFACCCVAGADYTREEVESIVRQKMTEANMPIVEDSIQVIVDKIVASGKDPLTIKFRKGAREKPKTGQTVSGIPISDWISDEIDLKDQYVVIDFWATWCKPCIAAIPHINELYHEFKDRAQFIGISKEPKKRVVKSGLATFDYLSAVDTQGRLSNELGIRGIPHIVVLDPELKVIWRGHPNQLSANLLKTLFPQANS